MSLAWLLDTNVVSEALRPNPDPGVMAQLEAEDGRMAIPSVVWHELSFGMLRLPPSRRRDTTEAFLSEFVAPVFPVLPYDDRAAAWHAAQRAALTAAGKPPPFVDGQIAAIAAVNDLTLVTRNIKDFERFEGLPVIRWHGAG